MPGNVATELTQCDCQSCSKTRSLLRVLSNHFSLKFVYSVPEHRHALSLFLTNVRCQECTSVVLFYYPTEPKCSSLTWLQGSWDLVRMSRSHHSHHCRVTLQTQEPTIYFFTFLQRHSSVGLRISQETFFFKLWLQHDESDQPFITF